MSLPHPPVIPSSFMCSIVCLRTRIGGARPLNVVQRLTLSTEWQVYTLPFDRFFAQVGNNCGLLLSICTDDAVSDRVCLSCGELQGSLTHICVWNFF